MEEVKRYSCPVCGAEFETSNELEEHRGEAHRQAADDLDRQQRDGQRQQQPQDGREVF